MSLARKIILIHDSYGDPQQHWFPWALLELQDLGYEVYNPRLPSPMDQSLESWLERFDPYVGQLTPETIVITHGIGAAFLFHALRIHQKPIQGLICVAPYISNVEHEGLNVLGSTFLHTDFDWFAVKRLVQQFMVIGSTNDPFVSQRHVQAVGEILTTTPIFVTDAGHFTDADGYEEFPQLFDAIARVSQPKKTEQEQAMEKVQSELGAKGVNLKDDYDDTKLVGETTYYQDITNTISNADAKTMATILEGERQNEVIAKEKQKSKKAAQMYAMLGVLFVLLGIGVLTQVQWKEEAVLIQQETIFPSVIRAEDQSVLVTGRADELQLPEMIEQHYNSRPALPGGVHHMVWIENVEDKEHMSFSKMVSSLGGIVPVEVSTGLGEIFMYGWTGTANQDRFILATIDEFDEVFKSLREWEETMVNDLADVMIIRDEIPNPEIYKRTFAEEMVNNRSVRVVYAPEIISVTQTDNQGEIIKQEEVAGNEATKPETQFRFNTRPKVMPAEVLDGAAEITDEEVVFETPFEFLRTLEEGDTLIAVSTENTVGFVKTIQSIDVVDGKFILSAPTETVSTLNQKFVQTVEEDISLTLELGEEKPLLFYTFLNEKVLVIGTDYQIIDEVLGRISAKQREKDTIE